MKELNIKRKLQCHKYMKSPDPQHQILKQNNDPNSMKCTWISASTQKPNRTKKPKNKGGNLAYDQKLKQKENSNHESTKAKKN